MAAAAAAADTPAGSTWRQRVIRTHAGAVKATRNR